MERREVPGIVKDILNSRGLDEKQIESFLFSGISSLCDPFSIPCLHEACETLKKAIAKNQKIFLYGDGDVDGVCAIFLLYSFMEEQGADFSYYLTHRREQNYEIDESFVDDLKTNGYSLVITADCGISSISALNKAAELGIKFIVLDHHIGDHQKLSPFHTYVNPFTGKWDEDVRHLSGAGIAFKFIAGMEQLFPGFREKKISELFEIPCIASLADFVELTGENRILVKEGLRRMPFTAITGLKVASERYRLRQPVKTADVIMKLNPKLNSPGRLGKPEMVLELLLEKDRTSAEKIAAEIDAADKERYREITKIMKTIEQRQNIENGFIVFDEQCRGFSGVIASRLSGKYKKPFLVCYEQSGEIRGSMRSPEGLSLQKISSVAESYMEEMGGHNNAMGFKCSHENLEKLKQMWVSSEWDIDTFNHYDCELDVDLLSPLMLKEIYGFLEPFGKGNAYPVFLCKEAVFKNIRQDNSQTTRCWISKNDTLIEAFLPKEKQVMPEEGQKTDITYSPYLREANGLYRIFIRIVDF